MKTLALALALAMALAAAIPAQAADLADVTARGTVRVIVMPLSAADEFFPVPAGARPGFDREVLDGFAGLHRIKLVVVPVEGWDNLVPALLQGRGDLIAGRFTVTDARLKQIAFSNEVFPSRNVVLTRRPHAPVQTLEALRLEKVGTIRGSSMAEAVRAVVPASNVDDSFPPAVSLRPWPRGRSPRSFSASKARLPPSGRTRRSSWAPSWGPREASPTACARRTPPFSRP